MGYIDIDRFRELLLTSQGDPGGPLEGLCKAWQCPRTMLDGDLEKIINEAKGTSGIFGEQQISLDQIQVIIEALRTKQYHGIIQALLDTFSGTYEIFPVRLPGRGTKCALCNKDIMYWSEWSETVKECPGLGEFRNRNFLAYGTKSSRICVCLDCLVQLRATKELLDELDPGILNYQKRTPGSLKP